MARLYIHDGKSQHFLSSKIMKLSTIRYFHVKNPKKVVQAQNILILGVFQGIGHVTGFGNVTGSVT